MKRLIIFYLSTFLLSNPLYGGDGLTNKQLAKFNKFKSGKVTWAVRLEEEAQMQQAWDLQKGGATQREISKELEISLGKVNKLLKKARQVELP